MAANPESYLQDQGIENSLAACIATLLREQPADGVTRLGELLIEHAKTKNGGGAAADEKVQVLDYDTITRGVKVDDAISAVEGCFRQLAKGEVDVPLPMHIGIAVSSVAGPGDAHIKGGYVKGTKTFTVKLASVGFLKNKEKGKSPNGGVFVVMNAETGSPLAVMRENRYLTDLRTGAAGAIALKYLSRPQDKMVGFIGVGDIAKVMARAAAVVRPGFVGLAWSRKRENADKFCRQMNSELGLSFSSVATAQELCGSADVIYTQTPGVGPVLELGWLKPHATIIASGSDQPTKQELPVDVIAKSKYVPDLTRQVARVGELRSAIAAGVCTESHVHAELGEVVNGNKPGRVGDELIVCDLTGTGAQDAAIGEVAYQKLCAK